MSLAKTARSVLPSVRPSLRTKTFVTNSDSEKLERRNRQLERASERSTDERSRQEREGGQRAEERRADKLPQPARASERVRERARLPCRF